MSQLPVDTHDPKAPPSQTGVHASADSERPWPPAAAACGKLTCPFWTTPKFPLRRLAAAALLAAVASTFAQAPPPLVRNVELQPLVAQVRRLIEALDYLGEPFSETDRTALARAMSQRDADAADKLQRILDARVLFAVHINLDLSVGVALGSANPELVEGGWRQFLVKIANDPGASATLLAVSPNAQSVSSTDNSRRELTVSDDHFRQGGPPAPVPPADRWLDLQSYDAQPLRPTLSGLALEYRIVQLYSRDAGRRKAKVAFTVGRETPDRGIRNDVDVFFTCRPAREINLRVLNENGQPTTASFTIRDRAGRVYPSQAKRLAPDFAFHPQVYRSDGETLRLPDGMHDVRFEYGPEAVPQTSRLAVDARTKKLEFKVIRWIDPSKSGWWSGDHHIHAAGCAHYTNPTEGIHPPDMAKHILGEDLKVGAILTMGPAFDYQKQFFTGADDKASRYPHLLHYDIEVAGFGSHRSGHLCLLRLREQIYPGGDSLAHWPTLCLNTIRWAKKQGALVGTAHSGWGLQPDPTPGASVVSADMGRWIRSPGTDRGRAPGGGRNSGELRLVASLDLPNYVIPPFDGIGANEYIMDVTHEVPGPDGRLVPAVDFLATVDTPSVWELNIWYHTLNAGFRTRISGETDFPCIYGERVGLGRSYVKLDGQLSYDAWCEGIRNGRNYVGDGKSHLMDFAAVHVPPPGEGGPTAVVHLGERGSELKLARAGTVKFTARVAARLNERPDPAIRARSYAQKPYWDIERARLGESRDVPLEVVVNGYPVARQIVAADAKLREVSFDVPLERSSWVALRILPSSHTNPIWVSVGDQPVRASRRSIEWCLKGVDQCWSQKEMHIAAAELPQARADYEHARQVYRQRLSEADVE
ncbi:MAG: CehA/McbA family metallohydrolase [Verrucomicrobia bacterium]|nr:CehA/McbA family metallohydrolase [Verrucomicrobiota bacterium]